MLSSDFLQQTPFLELLFVAAGFVVLSGILALIDAAILSVSRAEIEEMILQKKPGAIFLRRVHRRITRAVVVIVILTNTVNILGPILVGQRAIALFGDSVIGVITAILTFCTIVFSEVIPKSFGARHAPIIARIAAVPILTLITVLWPLVWILELITKPFTSGRRAIGTEDQIRSLVTIGRLAGHIESDEGQLVHRAFILNDKTARDIMTPLKDVIGVKAGQKIADVAQKVFRENHSRFPVFGKSIHDVRGIVMSYDILQAIIENRGDQKVQTIMQQPLVVPWHIHCDSLLVVFRDRHTHLAVVQEHKHTIGVVSLEDVLEELVGEIEDERDVRD